MKNRTDQINPAEQTTDAKNNLKVLENKQNYSLHVNQWNPYMLSPDALRALREKSKSLVFLPKSSEIGIYFNRNRPSWAVTHWEGKSRKYRHFFIPDLSIETIEIVRKAAIKLRDIIEAKKDQHFKLPEPAVGGYGTVSYDTEVSFSTYIREGSCILNPPALCNSPGKDLFDQNLNGNSIPHYNFEGSTTISPVVMTSNPSYYLNDHKVYNNNNKLMSSWIDESNSSNNMLPNPIVAYALGSSSDSLVSNIIPNHDGILPSFNRSLFSRDWDYFEYNTYQPTASTKDTFDHSPQHQHTPHMFNQSSLDFNSNFTVFKNFPYYQCLQPSSQPNFEIIPSINNSSIANSEQLNFPTYWDTPSHTPFHVPNSSLPSLAYNTNIPTRDSSIDFSPHIKLHAMDSSLMINSDYHIIPHNHNFHAPDTQTNFNPENKPFEKQRGIKRKGPTTKRIKRQRPFSDDSISNNLSTVISESEYVLLPRDCTA